MTGHPGVLLDAIAADPLPSRQTDRQHIEAAVNAAAAAHNGIVHISTVRPLLTRNVWQPMLGSVISAMARAGRLEWTGDYLPNGGPSGNGAKPARVWRLTTPTPTETS